METASTARDEALVERPDVLAQARSLFRPGAGVTYLDTATYGLPPLPTVRALETAIADWQAGSANWIEDWDRPADRSRADFATLIGAATSEIAFIPAASVATGLVAQELVPGDEVVVPSDEFTSTLFPLLVAGEHGAIIREVAFDQLAASVGANTRLVAFSLVQMQTGKMADLAAILDAAERHGAQVLVDATQSVPFVDVAPLIERVDYLACAAYKHLLCPRGVAFMYVRPDRWSMLRPTLANWRAADDPFGRYFGGPLTLAPDARQFDVSRAWFPWFGAAESMRLLVEWKTVGLFDEVLRLAAALAERLDVEWFGSSLVCAPIDDATAVNAAIAEAGVRASVRGEAIRLALHVYNTDEDVERAAQAVRPFVVRPG